MSTEDSGSSYRFSLKSLLLLVLIVGLILGWWSQYSGLARELNDEKRRRQEISFAANTMLYEEFDNAKPYGRAAAEYPLEALASRKFDRADWERVRGNLWPMHDDDSLEVNPIPSGGTFVGYLFEMEDDGEGSAWRYFVATRNDIIVEVAITPPTLD